MSRFKFISSMILVASMLMVSFCYGSKVGARAYNRGIMFATEGKFKEAKIEFEKALKVDPFDTSARECLRTIDDVIAKKIDGKAASHNFRGVDYTNRKKFGDAIAEFNKAVKIAPGFSEPYANKGEVYSRKGQYEEAIAEINKAIKINPKVSVYYFVQRSAHCG